MSPRRLAGGGAEGGARGADDEDADDADADADADARPANMSAIVGWAWCGRHARVAGSAVWTTWSNRISSPSTKLRTHVAAMWSE